MTRACPSSNCASRSFADRAAWAGAIAAGALLVGCLADRVPVEPPFMQRSASAGAPATPIAAAPLQNQTPQTTMQTAPIAAPGASAVSSAGAAGSPAAQLPPPDAAIAIGMAQPVLANSSAAAPSGPSDPRCDLRGGFIEQLVMRNTALGTLQLVTTWHYHRFEQSGDGVQIVASLDCGLAARGTTDVSLSDATLEGIATHSVGSLGVRGTFKRAPDGKSCQLTLDRSYGIRGASRDRFLTPLWKVGDPPKALAEFKVPTSAADGMEDWDGDGHEGITVSTGLGDRYTAQIDYFSVSGLVPLGASQFGGDKVLNVDHDQLESVSAETPLLLRATGTPMPPGYSLMARVDSEFSMPSAGEHRELQACKQVQALAVKKFGDPPHP